METECSDALRALAPRWSLEGDEKLLDILQNTHKNILSKCQEVNAKLEEMSCSLDDASISLQNVNNKFLALSNSQFIESRVYDDDADVTTDANPVKEPTPPVPSQDSELEMLKRSIAVLQEMHEPVTILKDSDTETDSDGEDGDRVVLKPKDLYSDRPLPYIIGTEAWKNSWHAGLIPKDSDEDSGSEGREQPSPQYSDSEPEDIQVTSKANATISETSSELASEQDIPGPAPRATPADIAADLARRLGGHETKPAEPDPEYAPAMTVSKTVYRPQQPQTGTIFADEPPPLDESESESSEEDDIFAELHTTRPKDQTRVVEDLFGVTATRDTFSNTVAPQMRTEVKQPPFVDTPDEYESRPAKRVEEDTTVLKKPVGGISLFGNNKGAESIGAAILKRNQKKSTSEEETDSEERTLPPKSNKTVDQTDSVRKEKDIFEDLFAKSASLEKKKHKEVIKDTGVVKSVVKDKPVVDLFSDNLFDDVGDIFTSNAMNNSNKGNQKSIFDDDDDLFADIAAPTVSKSKFEVKTTKIDTNKSLFDSDDELFSEKSTTVAKSNIGKNETQRIDKSETNVNNKINVKEEKPEPSIAATNTNTININSNIKTSKITKSIFDSDSDSDIFSDLVKKGAKEDKSDSKLVFGDNVTPVQDIFRSITDTKSNVLKTSDETKNLRSPSIFDDEDDNLFNDTIKVNKTLDVKARGEKEEVVSVQNNVVAGNTPKIVESTETIQVGIDNDELFEVKESKMSEISNADQCSKEEQVPEEIKQTDYSKHSAPKNQKPNTMHEETESKLETNFVIGVNNRESIEKDSLLPDGNDPISMEDKVEQNINNTQITTDNVDKSMNDTLFQGEIDPISKDIFDDEPPVFEKAKEPKRSKNVNALFDDDSEDEALFFRRSDVEEKTENFTATDQTDRLFGIFHDEPPAIDNFGKDDEAPDIFDTVIPKSNDSNIFKEPPKNIDKSVTPSVESKFMNTEDYEEANTSQTEAGSIKNDEVDDILRDDKHIEIPESKNKPLNIHNAFNEIKENEFDDIFKSASKIVHDDNDDIFKATSIDSFIKSTENGNFEHEQLPESTAQETNMFGSNLPDKLFEVPAKSEFDLDSDEELFRTMPKPDKPVKVPESLFKDETDKYVKSDIFKELDRTVEISNKTEINKEYEKITDIHEKAVAETKPDLDASKDAEVKLRNNDIKKVGRIKSMNLNIDVATLLPGASPKKQKSVMSPKERDSEPSLPVSPDERKTTILPEKPEQQMVNSISFDGEPNSEILDNKLSKERARIQVKRRPSTRKARREAVRKSAIDIDDSTDNSSSIDDAPRSVSEKSSSESPSKTIDIKNTKESSSKLNDESSMFAKIYNKDTKVNTEPKVTSKIVYILNDEDIFDTKPETVTENDLFKDKPAVSTLGSVYKGDNEKTGTIDKVKTKVSIFDSDSDEELFGGKRKEEKKRFEVKGSLFGDDEDDDLFGAKTKKSDLSQPTSSKSIIKEKEKSSEPVFNDPLSMLGDDE